MPTVFGLPLGTASNVGAFLALAGILGFIARVYIAGAPARLLAKNEGDASLRSALMARVDKLEETQVADREKHASERAKDREDCDARTDKLEQRIRKQNETIDGLQRQLIMFQVASARALPLGAASPELEAMLETLGHAFPMMHAKSQTLQSAEDAHAATGVTVEQVHQDEASR